MKERIQKVLSDSGIASRRQIERFIQEKRIFVGDRLAKLGDKISRDDQIFLDGKKIILSPEKSIQIQKTINSEVEINDIIQLLLNEKAKNILKKLENQKIYNIN